jgi:hypothetical protein
MVITVRIKSGVGKLQSVSNAAREKFSLADEVIRVLSKTCHVINLRFVIHSIKNMLSS